MNAPQARKLCVPICASIAIVMLAQPISAYLKFGVQVGSRTVVLKWSQMPVRYFISQGSVPGVGSSDLQAAVARAFATWEAVPTASITYQFAGTTTARPLDNDGSSTIGFLARPDLDRVLATTHFLLDSSTGAIVEADIFFNSAFPWSVAANGEANKFDLESVALHENRSPERSRPLRARRDSARPDGGRRVDGIGCGHVSDRTRRRERRLAHA